MYFSELLRTMGENKHVGTSWTVASEKHSKSFFHDENIWQILVYFRSHFHNEEGHWQKSYFELFSKRQPKLFVCKISMLSATLFMFFANIWSIYDKYLEEIFFLYSFDSFAPETCELHVLINFKQAESKLRITLSIHNKAWQMIVCRWRGGKSRQIGFGRRILDWFSIFETETDSFT